MKFLSESNHKPAAIQLFIPLSIGLALSLLGDTMLYTVLPQKDITLQAGLTTGTVGLILGINRLVRLFTNHPIGYFYCFLPRRKIMIPAAFLGVMASICYALSTNAILMIIGRIIWGLAWSGLYIGATTMVLDLSTENNRGKMSGILACTKTIGMAVCSLASGFLCDWIGFRTALWCSAAACLLNAIIWILFLPETFHSFQGQKTNSQAAGERKPGNERNLLLVSGLMGIPLFAMNFVFYGVVFSTAILWLEQLFGKGVELFDSFIPIVTLTGIYSALRIVIGAASGPLAGALTDRNRKRKKALILTMSVGAAGALLLGSSAPELAFSGALLGSFAAGAIPTLVYAWAGDRFQTGSASKAVGMINSLGDLGSALGPIIALNLIPLFGLSEVYSSLGFIFIAAILSILKL